MRGSREEVKMHHKRCAFGKRGRLLSSRDGLQARLPLSVIAWYGVALFLCLFVNATLNAINTQAQRNNYRLERLTVMLRMRHESLLRALSVALSPAHAEEVAEKLSMRRAGTKDCKFVVIAPVQGERKVSVDAMRAKEVITDASSAIHDGSEGLNKRPRD